MMVPHLVLGWAAVVLATAPSRAHEGADVLLELLKKPSANGPLINTIVECLESNTGRKTMFGFVKCVNDRLHIHQRTKFDTIGFIMGNFMSKAATQMVMRGEGDLYEQLKVVGDCIPMLLRNLFGVEEFSFSCKKRTMVENYDDPSDEDFDDYPTED
ncbi:uncharacterized protein BcabD6B2_24990 [Babesia caballi]|uniref:Membrane protein, putative n=1 Tax=Babesia caballi TaxID=5871 RepID=A0AAV4LTC0_BABCB|nr:membrane protein, putative [Babesia caballi]